MTRPEMTVRAANDLLAAHRLFGLLSEAARGRVMAGSRMVALAPGEALFAHGDPSREVYVVAEGRVAVGTVGDAGQLVHFADLGPGALLGEFAVIDGAPRSASAEAVTRARLLKLGGERVLDALRDEPGFALALLRDLTAKMRAADGQIEDRGTLGLDERLAKFLRANASDGVIALTQAQIAERLGVSREAANRRLRAMEAGGHIVLGRGSVTLLRPGT